MDSGNTYNKSSLLSYCFLRKFCFMNSALLHQLKTECKSNFSISRKTIQLETHSVRTIKDPIQIQLLLAIHALECCYLCAQCQVAQHRMISDSNRKDVNAWFPLDRNWIVESCDSIRFWLIVESL